MTFKNKVGIITLIATVFVTINSKAQVASDKPMEAFLSNSIKQKLAAKPNSRHTTQQNASSLPSAKPSPATTALTKIKNGQTTGGSHPTLPESEMKKRLPSNTQQINQRRKLQTVPAAPNQVYD